MNLQSLLFNFFSTESTMSEKLSKNIMWFFLFPKAIFWHKYQCMYFTGKKFICNQKAAIFHIILFVLVSNSYTLHNTKQILHGSCFSSNYNRPSIQFQSISWPSIFFKWQLHNVHNIIYNKSKDSAYISYLFTKITRQL